MHGHTHKCICTSIGLHVTTHMYGHYGPTLHILLYYISVHPHSMALPGLNPLYNYCKCEGMSRAARYVNRMACVAVFSFFHSRFSEGFATHVHTHA